MERLSPGRVSGRGGGGGKASARLLPTSQKTKQADTHITGGGEKLHVKKNGSLGALKELPTSNTLTRLAWSDPNSPVFCSAALGLWVPAEAGVVLPFPVKNRLLGAGLQLPSPLASQLSGCNGSDGVCSTR